MSFATLASKSKDTAGAEAKSASSVFGSLRIGEPNDAFEQEADRVADAVMAGGSVGPQWSLSQMGIDAPLRRKCSCGGTAGADGECEECKGKQLQRKAASERAQGEAPPMVHEVLRSTGQSLDAATRAYMELRFEYDFGHVRVHVDEKSARSAQAVDAQAYTVGRDVVFGRGLLRSVNASGSSPSRA